MQKINDGVILLLGNSEASTNYPSNTYKFRQDSSFLYFFGHNEPDLAAILDPQSGEQILFGNNVDMDDIIWMGPQPTIAEKGAKVGITLHRLRKRAEKCIICLLTATTIKSFLTHC